MRKLFLFLLIASIVDISFAQNRAAIKGEIKDEVTGEPLIGATVKLRGSSSAVVTDNSGGFTIVNAAVGKNYLIVSHVGYEEQLLSATVSEAGLANFSALLTRSAKPGDEVVVSASRRPEKITYAPAAIQVIGTREIEQFTGSNVGELVSKVQGVEYTRNGLTDITFNARGLHSAFNNKVFQLVDGRNTMAALSGSLPMMNRGSTMKDDIEKLEIVLGPQTALYGPNAHNAVFNTITKDPRKYPGTTVSLSAGSRYQFSGRLRQAGKINNKFAYKFTGEYSVGKEFDFRDSIYAGNQTGTTPFYGPAVAIPERISDFNFRHIRGEAHAYYTIRSRTDLIVSAGSNTSSWPQVTTAGRNQMRGVTYSFVQARLVHPHFFFNVYNTWGSIGTSYPIFSYTRDYWNRTHSSLPPSDSLRGRLSPDSAEIFALRLGNMFKEKSQRTNAETQYNYNFKKQNIFLVVGLNYQQDRPNGYGINLVDSFRKIRVSQYGGVAQLEKSFKPGLRLISAARLDHHENFGTFLAPKFGIVKSIYEGNVRLTWARAFAMPSILNQYSAIGRTSYGNGAGVRYIPSNRRFSDPASVVLIPKLKPEEVSTWEIGYKGNVVKQLYLDANYYRGVSRNFLSPGRAQQGRILSVGDYAVYPSSPGTVGADDTLRGGSFSTFFNYGKVRVSGVDAGLTYSFNRWVSLSMKYSWCDTDLNSDTVMNDANKDGHVTLEERSLNAPRNRGLILLDCKNIYKNKFYGSLSVRVVEKYNFYSGNQIGTDNGEGSRGIVERPPLPPLLKNFDHGPLGGFATVDLSIGYRHNEMVGFGVGITNLLDTKQIEFVGSPSISRLFSFQVRVHVP